MIKTVGTTQTRVADTASGSGSSTVINSTEGVLYFEGSAFANDSTYRMITISDGTFNNIIRLFYLNTNAGIRADYIINGVPSASMDFEFNVTENSKIAFS